MANRVRGITVEIGGNTTKLNKALEDTNKQIGRTQTSLKDVERLLKLDPTNTELLSQKQRLLAEAISGTKDKLDALKTASEKAAGTVKNYDAWKAAFDPIQEEITTTKQKLAELRDQQKEMEDFDQVDTDAYSQLKEQVDDTYKKLKALKEQAKEVSDQFGNPISLDQYDSLQREIIATEQQLQTFERRAEETDEAIQSISHKAIDEVSDSANKAEAELEEMATAAKKVKDKAAGIADAFQPATAAFAGLAAAAVATVPATEELRDDLSKLDANAENSAASVDAAREAWKKFAVQTGETDSSVEAVSNLLQAGFTESNLQKAVEGLAGAALQFPDTLKIESLADSLQETLATGSATGQFSELLSRLGMDAEAFSMQLGACSTEAERQNFVLDTLAAAGLNNAYTAWQSTNQEMLANKEANLELQLSMAQLAEVLLPIITRVTSGMANFVGWFANLSPSSQTAIAAVLAVVAAISPLSNAVSGAAGVIDMLSSGKLPALSKAFDKITGTVLPAVQGAFSSVFSFIAANPVVLLIGAIVGLVALIATKGDEIQAVLAKVDRWLQGVFATDWTKIFGPVLGGALNSFFAAVKGVWDSVKQIFDGVIDFIRGVFTGDWERAWSGCVSIFSGIFSGLKNIAKTPLNAIISLINRAIDGINSMITKINKVPGVNLGTIGHLPMLKDGGTLYSGDAIVGEAGPELLTVSGGKAIVRPLTNSSTTNNTTNLGGTTINVYAHEGQDVHDLAHEVMDLIQEESDRKAAAFGV